MSFSFWIILLGAVVVLGAIALGTYLFAARKLYSRDKQVVSSPGGELLSPPPPKDESERGVP
ncbi:MAG TPA: hypothetical protein VG206_24690 [Terriglobia bacterium]|nr:hypothetical protein [Terriglobia bacterium]